MKDGPGGQTKVEDKQYSSVVLFKEGFTVQQRLEENCKIMRKYSSIHDKDNDLIEAGNTQNLYPEVKYFITRTIG